MPVIFTYLRADCPCDVTTFLDLTSFRLLTGTSLVGSPGQKLSGWVGSRVKNPDLVPCLRNTHTYTGTHTLSAICCSCYGTFYVNFLPPTRRLFFVAVCVFSYVCEWLCAKYFKQLQTDFDEIFWWRSRCLPLFCTNFSPHNPFSMRHQ